MYIRTIAINQDCPRQIVTYVHSNVIENGNAKPRPLFSRSLQSTEKDRNKIYIYILRVLKQAFLIKQGFQGEVTNKPLSSLEEGLWTCERNKKYKTFLQD